MKTRALMWGIAVLSLGCAASQSDPTPGEGGSGGTAVTAGVAGSGTGTAGAAGTSTTGVAGVGVAGHGEGGSVAAAGSGGSAAGSSGQAGAGPGYGGSSGPAGSGGRAGGSAVAGAGGKGGAAGAGQAGRGGSAGGSVATAGSGGGAVEGRDHCTYGYPVDSRDAQITSTPDQWKSSSNEIDLVLPAKVLDWMGERVWEQSHDAWHNVRRCTGGATGICAHPELVPDHKECADAEDGYQFLVMHRHMMQALRQAFPQHTALFEGFPKFPYNATDVPAENKLSMFPTEGDLGKYIQCGGMSSGASSIHGALHFKWVVNSSPHSLGKQTVNIDNYMFWKLHGWIDKIWERYRVAKGQKPDEPKLLTALDTQCREMHQLGLFFDPSIGNDPDAPLPVEKGYFHEKVRPIFEKYCSGCHSESSPEANQSLGGHISSADVVKNLVNVNSLHGGQFKRIVPNDPTKSWLYLKVSGMAADAGCTGNMCNAQVMPPTGAVTLTTAELDTIKSWITMGAPAPTQ
jgi:hypothetical protein